MNISYKWVSFGTFCSLNYSRNVCPTLGALWTACLRAHQHFFRGDIIDRHGLTRTNQRIPQLIVSGVQNDDAVAGAAEDPGREPNIAACRRHWCRAPPPPPHRVAVLSREIKCQPVFHTSLDTLLTILALRKLDSQKPSNERWLYQRFWPNPSIRSQRKLKYIHIFTCKFNNVKLRNVSKLTKCGEAVKKAHSNFLWVSL